MEQEVGLISIIVPVYNVESYLERCVDSIIHQTYKNLEIILVDDGSTDRCGEICDEYSKIDERVKVIHKKNGGLSSARNSGLEAARGKYIGFVDSDDYIAEDMYEALFEHMSVNVDITCCGEVHVSFQKKYNKMHCLNSAKIFHQEDALEELLLLRKISTSACTKLFRKALFDNIRFPVGAVSEDVPVLYNLIKRSRDICHIGKAKYFYCYRKESISHKEFYFRRIDYLLFKRDICIDVRKTYPRLIMQAEAGYIQAALYIIGNICRSQERNKYTFIEKRVKKLIRNMLLRGLKNPYIDGKTKKMLMKAGI